MRTYRTQTRKPDWVSQSRVIHSGCKMHGRNRWSVQVMRKRHNYGAPYGRPDKRGWTLWVCLGPIRFEVGTR